MATQSMTEFNPLDLTLAYVPFRQTDGGKTRPILLLAEQGGDYLTFPVTSQYTGKSPRIHRQYFEIVQWEQAGLRKPSWVDTGNYVRIARQAVGSFVGSLTEADALRLAEFLEK